MRTYLTPKVILFVILGLFQVAAMTAETSLIKILPMKNATRNVSFDLYIVADKDLNAVGLKMFDHEDKIWQTFNVRNVRRGLDVKKEGNTKIITLQSNDFEKDRGGHFTLTYLYNGATGWTEDMSLKFDFNGTDWSVYHRGRKVRRLDFHLNKFFGKVIGIKEVKAIH